MGDRGNIVVKDGADEVWLYSHWSGTELPIVLRDALRRGADRHGDGPYLARIIFQEMIGDDRGTTGFGIATRLTDNEHPVLFCDVDAEVVYCRRGDDGESKTPVRMDEYAKFTDAQAMEYGGRS
jgi:hypothetical protein